MRKTDSWDSYFRKKRFYDNQKRKHYQEYLNQQEKTNFASVLHSSKAIPVRSIAIMMDLEGTSNHIDASTAELFMKQVDVLRKQFGNDKAYICISTHARSSDGIKRVFDELAPFKTDNIILSKSFYYGGMYDYFNDIDYPMQGLFNLKKVNTFNEYYLDNSILNIGWFAVIDDSASESIYKYYQDNRPMVVLKPSQTSISKYNNFMYRETMTDNFDGVVELMDAYINDVKGMSYYDVVDQQEFMIRHLSDTDIHDLIRKRKFSELLRYLQSDMTDKDNFRETYKWLITESDIEPFGECYESYIEKILEILRENDAFKEGVEEAKKLIFKCDVMGDI